MLGYKLGRIFSRKYKSGAFESWTLDKKINYLNSIEPMRILLITFIFVSIVGQDDFKKR